VFGNTGDFISLFKQAEPIAIKIQTRDLSIGFGF